MNGIIVVFESRYGLSPAPGVDLNARRSEASA